MLVVEWVIEVEEDSGCDVCGIGSWGMVVDIVVDG